VLRDAGLPVPDTHVSQSVDSAMNAFAGFDGDVVVKPVFGGEGRGMLRLSDEELAHRCFSSIAALGGVLYVQRFVEHGGHDLRLLVLGDEVIAMRRSNPDDWRTNAARGATCRPHHATTDERDLALRAARAIRATVAGVDLVYDRGGNPFVLEINGVPGWQHIADVTGCDVAGKVIALAVDAAEAATNGRALQPRTITS
jgi:ribosomal protein S6--L-glutamate ligase